MNSRGRLVRYDNGDPPDYEYPYLMRCPHCGKFVSLNDERRQWETSIEEEEVEEIDGSIHIERVHYDWWVCPHCARRSPEPRYVFP